MSETAKVAVFRTCVGCDRSTLTFFLAPTTICSLCAADWRLAGIRFCRRCGCTDDHACEGGCWWVDVDLCSSCAQPEEAPV